MNHLRQYALVACAALLALAAGVPAADVVPPPILLANAWRSGLDVRDYLVSEKFDGVRAVWDGSTLRFRSGRIVPAPGWFTDGLPPQPLDGELWLARGRFDELSAIVRSSEADERWHHVRYLVFDSPWASGTFEQRIAQLAGVLDDQVSPERKGAPGAGWVQLVHQFAVVDDAALQRELARVLACGGEGLMLHRRDAPYQAGRSDDLLKLKPFADAEATVVGYLPGKGRNAGLIGALVVETSAAEGRKRFRVGAGLSDALRHHPPPVGTRITYRYTALTPAGLPRFPRYWRVRDDP